nr:unnamed protein product [Callosobruchus analis]
MWYDIEILLVEFNTFPMTMASLHPSMVPIQVNLFTCYTYSPRSYGEDCTIFS